MVERTMGWMFSRRREGRVDFGRGIMARETARLTKVDRYISGFEGGTGVGMKKEY